MKNTYKCSPEIWKKFNKVGRFVFNRTMRSTISQELHKHTDSPILPKKEWYVLRHNIACQAAWAAEDTYKFIEDFIAPL